MFLGEFTHSIDDKGRLTVPAKYRAGLAAGLVVTRGVDQNLLVYPMDQWMEFAQTLAEKPMVDAQSRLARRRLFSLAADLTPDRQGRILLPQPLREFAGLNGEAVIVGLFNHLEIWSLERWTDVRTDVDREDGGRLEGLGI